MKQNPQSSSQQEQIDRLKRKLLRAEKLLGEYETTSNLTSKIITEQLLLAQTQELTQSYNLDISRLQGLITLLSTHHITNPLLKASIEALAKHFPAFAKKSTNNISSLIESISHLLKIIIPDKEIRDNISTNELRELIILLSLLYNALMAKTSQ